MEEKAAFATTGKASRLSGAGKKRMKCLISQGSSRGTHKRPLRQNEKRVRSVMTIPEARLTKGFRKHFEAQGPNL